MERSSPLANGTVGDHDLRRNTSARRFMDAHCGIVVAAIEVWKIFLAPCKSWIYILLATLCAALAMLGPGAWSVDARLFGWKRIDIQDRKK